MFKFTVMFSVAVLMLAQDTWAQLPDKLQVFGAGLVKTCRKQGTKYDPSPAIRCGAEKPKEVYCFQTGACTPMRDYLNQYMFSLCSGGSSVAVNPNFTTLRSNPPQDEGGKSWNTVNDYCIVVFSCADKCQIDPAGDYCVVGAEMMRSSLTYYTPDMDVGGFQKDCNF